MIATIGFFDGVHEGHRYVLSQVTALAKERDEKSVVITFRNHPSSLFRPQQQSLLLLPPTIKEKKILECGIDDVVMLKFDESLANQTAADFLKLLKENFDVTTLLLGYDNHFGKVEKDENGNAVRLKFADYKKLGEEVGVEILQLQPFLQKESEIPTSSSLIRSLLTDGKLDEVNQRLGYDYTMLGVVIDGYKVGRKLGFPTANLHIENLQYPKNGVYAALCKTEDSEEEWEAVVNIGCRPTFNREGANVEVHIINRKVDIYGELMTLKLRRRLRDEKKFSSQEDLVKQIEEDVKLAVEALK